MRFLFFLVMGGALLAVSYLVAMHTTVSASDYERPITVGTIETDELKESSGLSASECQDVLWTHNDAGNDPVIFAMSLQGKHLGAWRLPNSQNIDWESIATFKEKDGRCYLLIGDIGDNDAVRDELHIYRIPEPMIEPGAAPANLANARETAPPEMMKVSYGEGRHNAETLVVHPGTGNLYIVTKERSGPAAVHRIKPAFGSRSTIRTEKVASIAVPASPEGRFTGGSFSPDGRRVMLCDLRSGYELLLPPDAVEPEAIWFQKPVTVDVGSRKQGEGVSYARDGLSVFASSEKQNTPIFQIRRKGPR